jgi:hypothetical protein
MSRNKESFQSRAVKIGLRILGINGMWKQTGAPLRKIIDSKQLKESYEPPIKISQKYNCTKQIIAGHPYYVVSKKGGVGDKHILYLHGGG